MIDAQTLLDPRLQNSQLRAYFFLSTQYSQGARSSVDCLQPFVIFAIAESADDQLVWSEIRDFLKDKYGLNIPYYMLERMQGSLIQAGALERSPVVNGLLICKDARENLASRGVDFDVSHIDRLGVAIDSYAKRRQIAKPLTANSWAEILIPFLSGTTTPEDKATSTVKGVIISNPKTYDFAVVADFIVDEYNAQSELYKSIEKLYYGILVAEFLTQVESTGSKAAFKDLSVAYDAPVILRLLGCSGKILRLATEELHDSLRELGCKTYFFQHTYDEAVAAIEAILKCYENSQPMFRETSEAIAKGEIAISEIYAIRGEIDLRLAALGLIEHSSAYQDRAADDFQIDEAGFGEFLRTRAKWGSEGSQAAERDVASLAMVMRLRDGKQKRDVSKSGFIFVTHNPRLAVLSREFLRAENQLSEGSVWPVMTLGQISTIAWVVNEAFQNERRVTKELIANCYAAALPDDDFDEKLRQILVSADPARAQELYENAFLVQSVRQVALQQTGGHSALVRTLSVAEILAEADAHKEEMLSGARRSERALAREEARDEQVSSQQKKATKLSRKLAGAVNIAVAAVSAALILHSNGVFGRQQGEPVWIYSLLLAAVGVYAVVDLFKIVPSASLRSALESLFFKMIRSLQRAVA